MDKLDTVIVEEARLTAEFQHPTQEQAAELDQVRRRIRSLRDEIKTLLQHEMKIN